MAVSRAPNCGMFDPLYAVSLVSQGWSPVCLPSVVICLGNNFGRDAKWHNITTCSSVNFASEVSTLIWCYFRRHGDNCLSFSECINVDCRVWYGHLWAPSLVRQNDVGEHHW